MQEIHSCVCAFGIFARDTRFSAFLAADRCIKAFVALPAQLFDRNIFTYFYAAADLNTKRFDHFDFCCHKIFLQLIGRNTVAKHAARFFLFLKDRGLVSCQRQIVCTGKSCRTGTDDRDFLFKSTLQ